MELKMSYSPFDIAIIGMDCQLPQIADTGEFWQAVQNGEEKIARFTDDELRQSGVSEETLANPYYIKAGTYLEDATKFDNKFFGYLPREAQLIDPQQRIFLECCWKAMEDAGYVREKCDSRVGVYGGCNLNTYLLANILDGTTLDILGDKYGDQQIMIGNDKDYITTRVSFKLNLDGPSVNIQAACATSLYAIHLACEQINNGACDMAIAGGSSIRFPHKVGYFYKEGGTFSKDGHIYSFDANAQGSLPGYGAGAVVLKPVEKAMRDKDHIYAIIKGSAINNDGGGKSSFTAPNVLRQATTFIEAVEMAEVPMESISYIEAHGSGTIMGDPIEVEGFRTAFMMSNVPSDLSHKCVIGTVKPNIGHCDAAAGIAGIIKTALCLQNKVLPPLVNFSRLNSNINIDETNFSFINKAQKWEVKGYPLRASVNSLGMGGHNANIILEEPPVYPEVREEVKGTKIICLSARSNNSLRAMQSNLRDFINQNASVSLNDIEYTLHLGRKEFEYRKAYVCRDKDELRNKLENELPDVQKLTAQKKLIVLVSPHDTAPLRFMREMYADLQQFHEAIDRLKPMLAAETTIVLEKLLSGQACDIQGDEMKTCLVFLFSYALIQYFSSIGLMPETVLGSGMGALLEECLADASQMSKTLSRLQSGEDIGVISDKQPDAVKLSDDILGNIQQYLFAEIGATHAAALNEHGLVAHTVFDSDKGAGITAAETLGQFLGGIWEAGGTVKWDQYHSGHVYHRISLPTYPFEKAEMRFSNKPAFKNAPSPQTKASNVSLENNLKGYLNVEEVVVDLIEEITGCKANDLQIDVTTLGMSSLQCVQFTTRVNDIFSIALEEYAIEDAESIDAIIHMIKEERKK